MSYLIFVWIYNTLIDIQQTYYSKTSKIFNKFDLINKIPELKHSTHQHWKLYNSKAAQTVATEIYSSYSSFFNLVKKDKTAKPPQKKNIDNFHTLTYNQSGWTFCDNNIITVNKIPFKFKSQFDNIEDFPIKELRIKYNKYTDKWLIDIIVDDKITYNKSLNIQTNVLAIDLGLKKLGTCIDNHGNHIIIQNTSKKKNKYFSKHINLIKSKLSKKTKHSRSFKRLNKIKKKLYHRKNSQINQALHIQSKKLSNMNYNTIVVGDLTVKHLMSTIKNEKKGIRKSFHESNISKFLSYLGYKCQANQINLTKINEMNTTQLNCLTGKKFANKVELNQRTVELYNGLVIDRDLNSAINILKRYHDNHLASMNEPLEVNSNVLETIVSRKPIIL